MSVCITEGKKQVPQQLDFRQKILNTARLFMEPGQVTELNVVGARADGNSQPRNLSGFYNNLDRLADAVISNSTARGVFFVANPINPDLLERASNRLLSRTMATQDIEILRRRWMLIDIVPRHPAGVPITEAEFDAALSVRKGICLWLNERGWPAGITADSGSGIHYLCRIDLPVDDGDLVQRCLKALGARFDSDKVQINRTVFKAAQILPVYGTFVRTETASSERRYRKSRLLWPPKQWLSVSTAALEALAADASAKSGNPRTNMVPQPSIVSAPVVPDRSQPPKDDGALPAKHLPQVEVPGGKARVTDAARKLGELLGNTGQYFGREGSLVAMRHDENNVPVLQIVNTPKFISVAEEVCQPVKASAKGGILEPTVLGRQQAEAILEADALYESLPPVKVITRCPVAIERDGRLVTVTGYDRASGIYADGGTVMEVSLAEAKEVLWGLLSDFRFTAESDRSRALAALITPALVFGNLLPGRAPATVIEADKSQTGKGYLVKLIAAMYGDSPATVAQNQKGVGGLEESFDMEVMKGRAFVSLDNLKGKFNSPKLESFMTESGYLARIPYSRPVHINPRQTIVLATSNRAEFTEDFANRVSTVRLLKQPARHEFKEYPEGDLLSHVQANQALYLGAVFAVVKEWIQKGKPSSKAPDHDFRGWCGVADWIVQNLLGAVPLMAGHREIQRRTVSPHLNWLRDAAQAVTGKQRSEDWLRSHQILEIIRASPDIEIPGMKEGDNIEDDPVHRSVCQAIGKRISACLDDNNAVQVDGYLVTRRTVPDERFRDATEYGFQLLDSPAGHPEGFPEENPRNP